jgi:uncharacterized protein YjdB
MNPRIHNAVLGVALTLCAFAPAVAVAASDVVTVGNVTAGGTTVDVPIFIMDASGTPLGVDQPPGSRIQSYSIRVNYAPAAAVQSVTISRAGITAGLSPAFETAPAAPGSISLLDTFPESTQPIPFTLNAAAPGNLVAHMVVTLSAAATPGSSISLTLDSTLTLLSDAGGSAATKETVANGTLSLTSGAINIPQLSLSLRPTDNDVSLGETVPLSAILNIATTSNVTVSLVSSNPAVAQVPSSVTIPAGSASASFNVLGTTLGTATITASLSTGANASATVAVTQPPIQCTTPASPQLSGPASADAGVAYVVSWNAVNGATEYLLDESTDPDFAGASSQRLTTTSATFTHTGSNVRYFYRVRAHKQADGCDALSAFSTAISVLINPPPVAAMRVLAVVGSLQGGFGSTFKTSVQLYNPKGVTLSGRIVFHPANVSGSSSDPSLVYSIPPGRTLFFADLLPAMSISSGIGSADIVADLLSPLPISLVHVFNDLGPSGTSGLTEDALTPDDVLQGGNTAVLLAPADAQRFRLNIGVRTLEAGVTMTVTVRDKDGLIVKSVPAKSYGPTFFTQVASAPMLDGYVLTGGETISFNVVSGSAFLYGSTTDNTTNDPSLELAQKIE